LTGGGSEVQVTWNGKTSIYVGDDEGETLKNSRAASGERGVEGT
jgi:hypothetical protein